MKKLEFIMINDERIKLSTIKRYFPTKINKTIQGTKSCKYSVTVKLSVTKDSDSYVYKFSNRTEFENTLRKLDYYFNII
jgi:hypothetical protein